LRSKKNLFGDVKPFFAPMNIEKSSITDLPFEAELFAAADLEGNGSLKYVFSDGARLHIYGQSATGWREEWAEPTVSGAGAIRYLNLDAADVNGNGKPELFVTEMRNGTVLSHVVEYNEGLYQRIADVPGFLRVINYPGMGSILIGQDYDPRSFFSGPPRQYIWTDGKYVLGSDISLPSGIGLYGFVFANVGESSPLLMALAEKDHVVVYSKDTRIWRSEEAYQGIGITVNKPMTDTAGVISQSVAEADRSQKLRVPGRLLALDINGDGKDEIVLAKNIGDPFLGDYKQAEIVSLGWTGTRLEQRWTIRDIPGAVPDFQIIRQEKAGANILAIVKSSGGLFSRDTYRVMTYTAK